MVGVTFPHLDRVDIFDLLGLDPYELPQLTPKIQLEEIRKAYRRVMFVSHPDRAPGSKDGKATLLNVLKDFLCNFDESEPQLRIRAEELAGNGSQGWVSTWNPWLEPQDPGFWRPIPAYSRRCSSPSSSSDSAVDRTLSKPGSSPSNPIVIDATAIKATKPRGEGAPSRRKRTAKSHGRSHSHQGLEDKPYRLSGESRWNTAPYAERYRQRMAARQRDSDMDDEVATKSPRDAL